MDSTERLGLPLLASGQAQKEVIHNEALFLADLLVCGAAEGPPTDTPPATPVAGQAWIAGPSPSGAWTGKADHVAGFTSGGWRFVAPVEGMILLEKASGTFATYRDGSWTVGEVRAASLAIGGEQVVGAREAAIASPAGGSTVDSEARTAIGAILATLRNHGLIET